jgi:7-cyano-7-deazaguanine synthase
VISRYTIDTALFFDYGQIAARREEGAARGISSHYGLSFKKIELPWLGRISASALTGGQPGSAMLDVDSVWVENRNGIFVNIAASVAASKGCAAVITGFNREEAASFPDNSEKFVEAANAMLRISTRTGVRVESPTISMLKKEITALGVKLRIPWERLWSCYHGGEMMCGNCRSCRYLKSAVEGTSAAGIIRFETDE